MTYLFRPKEKVEFFFSFRSPYSYLAAPRVFALPRRFHIDIDLKPVPPMVERGVAAPRSKLLYIVLDAAREAKRLGMPFGRIFDPLGVGVRRCLAVAEYAKDEDREVDFVLAVSRAIWAQAVDISSERALRKLCTASGLEWAGCRRAIEDEAIAERLAANAARLHDIGHWGVPTFCFRGEVFWGQDRISHLELALAEAGLSTAPQVEAVSRSSARRSRFAR